MLLLVLDYTCLNDCEWEAALLSHLSWAYVERASVCLVQVGAASARHYLRAEQVFARNLLSLRLRAALRDGGGTATPLAHGLDLAVRTLRSAMEHGRGRLQRARVVVLSDGRGNVPLVASRAGQILRPVRREGVEDALRVARTLGALRCVDVHFLDPRPQQYPDFPLSLAAALNAEAEPIAPRGLTVPRHE
jgi:magnesium chelatase subunit D